MGKNCHTPIGRGRQDKGRSCETLTRDDIRHRIEARRERLPSHHSTTSHQSGGSGRSGDSRRSLGSSNLRYSYRADRDESKQSGVRLSESKSDHESRRDHLDLSAGPSTLTSTPTSATAALVPAKFGRIPKVDTSRKRSGDQAEVSREESESKRSCPEPKIQPELRLTPIIRRVHMLAIQDELKKENDVPYKEDDAMTFGFMFFRVIKGTISFANPSCHVMVIE